MTVTPEQLAALLDFRKLIGLAIAAMADGYAEMSDDDIQIAITALADAASKWKELDKLAEKMQKILDAVK